MNVNDLKTKLSKDNQCDTNQTFIRVKGGVEYLGTKGVKGKQSKESIYMFKLLVLCPRGIQFEPPIGDSLIFCRA